MKLMSEATAWGWLAKKWDAAFAGATNCFIVEINDGYPCCLCMSIMLMNGHQISVKTEAAMLRRIEAVKGDLDSFLWPRTRTGAKQRAAFCRKQAAQLKRLLRA